MIGHLRATRTRYDLCWKDLKMNDFTKEELQQIKFDMDMGQNRFDASFTNEMYSALEAKIQSMIDNYCEHERSEDHKI